jgi:hypothetical protein
MCLLKTAAVFDGVCEFCPETNREKNGARAEKYRTRRRVLVILNLQELLLGQSDTLLKIVKSRIGVEPVEARIAIEPY